MNLDGDSLAALKQVAVTAEIASRRFEETMRSLAESVGFSAKECNRLAQDLAALPSSIDTTRQQPEE